MGKRVLFSPVGSTDPTKNGRDGSLLHICRYYKPDIVYLYLSKEMLELHELDNRYVELLNRLGDKIDHTFEVRLYKNENLVDVHRYDQYYTEFREKITVIRKNLNEDDELLVNISSGTPAMKAGLMVLATLAEYKFMPVQVSNPKKSSDADNLREYDIEKEWAEDKDNENEDEIDNRCEEVTCLNLLKLLKIDVIKKHLEAYDYHAALAVGEEIRVDIGEEVYNLLKIADARVKLNSNKIQKLMKEKEYDLYPVKENKKQKIFEYALYLQMKLKKQEYVDFIRGITPIVVDLLELILEKQCNIKISDYYKAGENRKWDSSKLKGTDISYFLERTFKNFKYDVVYSAHLNCIIKSKCQKRDLIEKLDAITKVEQNLRNLAAHEIVSITEDDFRKKTGMTSAQIMDILRYLIQTAGINADKDAWMSYDNMNKIIIDLLD